MKEQYGLILIRNKDGTIVNMVKQGLLHRDFCAHNSSIVDNDGIICDTIKFDSMFCYMRYCEMIYNVIDN